MQIQKIKTKTISRKSSACIWAHLGLLKPSSSGAYYGQTFDQNHGSLADVYLQCISLAPLSLVFFITTERYHLIKATAEFLTLKTLVSQLWFQSRDSDSGGIYWNTLYIPPSLVFRNSNQGPGTEVFSREKADCISYLSAQANLSRSFPFFLSRSRSYFLIWNNSLSCHIKIGLSDHPIALPPESSLFLPVNVACLSVCLSS